MIYCQHLSRRYGPALVVDDLTFRIPLGSLCAFMGTNGAGKSTTLAMLTGQVRPSGGRVEVAGLDPSREPARLQRVMGAVPDRLALFDDLTLEEHLLMVAQVHGLARAVGRERAGRLLELLGLEAQRRTSANHASHGMRKKTALAMALMHGPRVLLLDEPFEGLDPGVAEVLQDVLKAYAAGGGTVLFSCHILSVVSGLATRCLMLQGGRLVGDFSREALAGLEHDLHVLPPTPLEDLTWLTSCPS